MENDQSLYTEYALKAGEFIAKDLDEFGKLVKQQNITEYQKIEATIARLTNQIERNQALAQAYLHRAVAEIGQDSKAAKLLTETAIQQTQVVNWLKGLNEEAIRTASKLERTLLDARAMKIIGEAGGSILDTVQIVTKLAEGNNTGVVDDAAGMAAGMILGAGAIALLSPAIAAGTVSASIAAGLVVLANGIGSFLGSSLSKQLEWSATLIDFVSRNLINPLEGLNNLSESIANLFNTAKRWTWPRDPIILDLDGDGLETVGLAANIHFDHNGDGVMTKTGWVGKDDALLVWDRNGNGTIDSGAELFGDFTPLPNGALAPNGFAALAALDSNGDGIIDASDPAFAELKLWRDADQNGITGQNELISLQDAGIVSLNLAHTLKNQRLTNGNTLAREGSFTRADGTSSAMGEFHFATDTFSTRFLETIDVPDALKTLPNLQASGKVRELQQAAAQSGPLTSLLTQFQSAATRAEQKALLDPLLAAWADTSGMGSLEQRAAGQYRIQYDAFGNERRTSHLDGAAFAAASGAVSANAMPLSDAEAQFFSERYRNLITDWGRKLQVLEAFNGQYFFNLPQDKSQTANANFGLTVTPGSGTGLAGLPLLRVSFSQDQLNLLQQAYESLTESIYAGLVMQTRLKPYLDAIELVIDDQGIRLDATQLDRMLADKRRSDPENYLADLLELDRYAGRFLNGTGWEGFFSFDQVIDTLPHTQALAALLTEFNVRKLSAQNDFANFHFRNGAHIVLAGDGDDILYGGNGNDRLFGQSGNDRIFGGNGDDLLSGGPGNDELYGGPGADTYIFRRGDGHDTVFDSDEKGIPRDSVRFLGLHPADIRVSIGEYGRLVFTIEDTGETLTIGWSGVGQYVFDDGTVWTRDDALRATVAPATEGNDVIYGSSAGETITGLAGDDILIGNGGDDVIDGGPGNDLLIGSTGWDRIWENGSYRLVHSTTPNISANGNDTYLFGRGDGQDTVIDGDWTVGNTDTLRFKTDVAPNDVRLLRKDNDLVLAILGTDDNVTLKHYFAERWDGANGAYLIERIAFDDGTVWSFDDVQAILFAGSGEAETIIGSRMADHLTGLAGNDTLIGREGDDLLEGGEGDDILLGGWGRDILDGGPGNDILRGGGIMFGNGPIYDVSGEGDTYRFGRGDGHDIIIEDSWLQGETDRIELKAGLTPDDVRLERVRTVNGWQVRDDLVLTIRDTGDTLTVKNHFNESNRHAVEEIVFLDGTVWDMETIKTRILMGMDGDDLLYGFNDRDDIILGGAGNDRLIGLGGNDTLDGGAGDDVLAGGTGSDTYRFGLGYGHDLIIEHDLPGEDLVELGAGIVPEDTTVRWTLQGDMAITLSDGSRLTVQGQASTWSDRIGIERLRFADVTEWNRADLAARALSATDGDDDIVSGYGDDILDGGPGNDRFRNLGGYDTYRFGIGDGQDVIEAARGRIQFKPGIGQNDIGFSADGNDLIVSVSESGDAIRIKDWLSRGQRIDRFEFANGARLTIIDVETLLNVSAGAEVIFGSPGNDTLVGTAKDSIIFGREGDDVLEGGAGRDDLYGEAGDDILDGGPDRDRLFGGEGRNTYLLAPGTGLDQVLAESKAVADDTVQFAPGIRPSDVSVQLGNRSWQSGPGRVGYANLVVGIGGDDAFLLQNRNGGDIGLGAVQRFRFDDGTELTLTELIALADSGKLGWQQRYHGEPTILLGSAGDDAIYDYTGQSVIVQARGNDDTIQLAAGNDIVSAGTGNDTVYAGQGDDLIAGEAGDDVIDTGEGDDTVVFNYGDGHDRVTFGEGLDTLSFGNAIEPALLAAAVDRERRVVLLVDSGTGGTITLDGVRINNLPGDLERIQFIDAEGQSRIFDFSGWLNANRVALLNATADAPLVFDGSHFELTGQVAPAGGLEAVAYAQSGDLFAAANLARNVPTDGDDLIYGTPDGDVIDAGAGNDIIMGLAGDDTIFGGEGNDLIFGGDGDDVLFGGEGDDVIYGGWGADTLSGGPGRDELYGEWGGDTYLYQPGDGVVIIDDDHRVLSWGYGGPILVAQLGEEMGGDGYGGGYGGVIIDEAPNILSFGPGVMPEDLRYSEQEGDLLIEFVNRSDDKLILRGYRPDRATQTRSVDIIRFADGTEIVAETIEVTGNTEMANDDGGWLTGTQFADTLIGGDGDDVFDGWGGADLMVGGSGSDTYRIHKENGVPPVQAVIVETWREQDVNRIELTGEINADDLRLAFDGRDLLLRLTEAGDTIRFAGFDPRAPGMQAPVDEIALPWQGKIIGFDELLAHGVRIVGTSGDDVLTGTELADWIQGLGGDDSLIGGEGGDIYVIAADGGTDTIIDSEDGGELNTLILPDGTKMSDVRLSYDGEGFLIIELVNTGNRIRLSGFDPMNPLGPRAVERFRFGLFGDEIGYGELLMQGVDIVGTELDDALKGTMLADRIWGGEGNDLIEATPGGDWLMGEGGNDIYVVNLGDGIVTIEDVASDVDGNVLRFGSGIDPVVLSNNLRFEADGQGGHFLLIPYGNEIDVVRLSGFNPLNVLGGGHAVERFEFADGTSVDYAELVSRTFVVEGDNTDNALSGTNLGDRLYGYDGDDLLEAGDGADVLTGGRGNDVLRGGPGRDAYVFNLGDGEDIIDDHVEEGIGNVLTFGEGIARDSVNVSVAGDDLLIQYGSGSDALRVLNYAPNGREGGTVIDTFEFADGTSVTLREFMNRAPVVSNAVDDQVALEDYPFSLMLPGDLFIDADGDDILTRVGVSGYERLPQWLLYDVAARTLYGTPDNDDVGEFVVTVQGMDVLGESAFYSFRITVQNTNDVPEVGTVIADVEAIEDEPFTFSVPDNAFFDVDAGDVLTFFASLSDGEPLPVWLDFDAVTRRFSGIPDNDAVGNLSIRLTATDLAGAQASQLFGLSVINVNDAPEAGEVLTDLTAQAGTLLNWQLPENAFYDVDAGDVLSYSAGLVDGGDLPDWLAFDPSAAGFSGTPAETGVFSVQITATDLAGAQASQHFTIDVVFGGGNQPPVTAPDQTTVIEDRKWLAWGNVLANDSDPDGDRLNVADPGIRRGEYGVLKLLPNGGYVYALDNFSSKVQGLGAGESAVDRFDYLASDGTDQSNGQLTVTVQGANDVPVLSRSLADVRLARGQDFSWQVPAGSFTDRDRNDTLSYKATLKNGQPLPGWLDFDNSSQTFSGKAPSNAKGAIEVQVVVTDGNGEGSEAADGFKIRFGNKTVVPKGNEGVGNGQDAPPPGHDTNQNDGPGTGPGWPGNKYHNGKNLPLDRFLDGFKTDTKKGYSQLPVPDRRLLESWLEKAERQPEPTALTGEAKSDAIEQHWRSLTQALAKLDAERHGAPAWSGKGHGADLSGLSGILSGNTAMQRLGPDAVGLAAGGTQIKSFTGLREGLSKLIC